MASSDHIHVYSLLGSLSKDDDATAIKCRVRGWRRVTFQTTTTTAEKQLNWVSVKRGVGVYLFFYKKECCVRVRVKIDTNPNPNLTVTVNLTITLTLKQHR